MQPIVTVVVPTFNRANTIVRCIESIRNQSLKNWELLVVDDGSVDNTGELVKEFVVNDHRIKYLIRDETRPKGANACRNIGIEQARGEFVSFLDSDDEWLADKLAQDLKTLIADPTICGLYSDIIIDDGQFQYKASSRALGENESHVDFLFSQGTMASTCTFTIKKESGQIVRFDESLQRHQDLDFFIRFGRIYGWKYLNVSNALIHWDGKQKKNFHFSSMIQYYEKYGDQVKSDKDHANYLLRQWVNAYKSETKYKKYYIRKLKKLFFRVGIKYKLFCLAPEFCFWIWKKTLESNSKFKVYPVLRDQISSSRNG